jgi:NAD(P)-dependent dehydrogenase (short-subunit alcohol dehydrogenase family)
MRLEEKIVVVTGAARGIGEACARRYAHAGAAVICVDVDEAGAERVAVTVRADGGEATAVTADIATLEGNELAIEAAKTCYGALDVFHANAAVQELGHLEATTDEQWETLHSVNLRGAARGIQLAIPELRVRGGGSIIITASLLGIVGDPDLPAYGAMKGGLRALCRSLATAHGPEGIRVNTICPGDVETPMLAEFFDAQPEPEASRAEVTARYPLRRFATPEDVANVAVFLASDHASYLTGIDIVVDGGLLARIY